MKIDNNVLDQLITYAQNSYNEKEIPVSAAIFNSSDNCLVAIAGNNRQKNKNVLGHAEINCILKAEEQLGDWRLDGYYMIVTLEPCDMCSIVIKESRLDKVYYFLPSKQSSTLNISINKNEILGYDDYKEKLNKLLTDFFDNMR
jgi:tRNA(Arg) A34 adenosine deaminase TadA